MAEALALAGTLDQARNVRDDEVGLLVEAHHAEVRFQRRERVVRNLRLGGRDHADEGRLAGVREPDERNVGHQLEFQAQPPFLAVFSLFGEARSTPPVRQELRVAPPPSTAGRGEPSVAVVDQLREHVTGVHVVDDGPHRDGDLE